MYTFMIEYNDLKRMYEHSAERMYSTDLEHLDEFQIQNVIADVIQTHIGRPGLQQSQDILSRGKVVVYFSMEFLEGRIIDDQLLNTGLKEMTKQIFAEHGVDIKILEKIEDAALGNGGLGRLAACYMESSATQGYLVCGAGMDYKYGLFRQTFAGHKQVALPDNWARNGNPWYLYDDSVDVDFKHGRVKAVPCILPIVGYYASPYAHILPLTLWRAIPIDGASNEIMSQISNNLYPNNDELRIYQEYFFVSATLKTLFARYWKQHHTLDGIENRYVFQMNDTHPVLSCIEFIRLLEEYGYPIDKAFNMAQKCFAYTNHTVLPEALESWNEDLFKAVVPDRIFEIIQYANQRLIDYLIDKRPFQILKNGKYEADWEKVHPYELIFDKKVHMSRIACWMSFAINGVAEIHSELIKHSLLRIWYDVFPEKFTNVTNGITQRRWLRGCNEPLSKLLDNLIGPGWTTDLEQFKLLKAFKSDPSVMSEFVSAKRTNREILAEYVWKREHVEIDPYSIYDCHVKRIHEYKRQLMNALRILYIYDCIKHGKITDFPNTTFIFGGKAADGYEVAKNHVSLLLDIQNMINNDTDMSGVMKVLFVTDFNVSYGGKIYPASDFSEQVSTAGKEASGTGNMKFSTNGALTIGTRDGANIEIGNAVGEKNIYFFGATVEELRTMHYNPTEFMDSSSEMQIVLPYLKNKGLLDGDYHSIIDKLRYEDAFFVMKDLKPYIDTTLRAFSDHNQDQKNGTYQYYVEKAWINLINSWWFSSDRAIGDYANRIWHIDRNIK